MLLGTIGSLLNLNENDEGKIIEPAVNVLSKYLSLEKLCTRTGYIGTPYELYETEGSYVDSRLFKR
ncbi:hypothetical protein [Bacillus cereus]|uniref:Uncharacterized protein n=1 Tax=Bacillus cereus MC67 TaxID=1053219 RepID=J8EYI1_BACCE|nr:hypothetical protein [Bacillus cereus]EJQ93769.1 hypothetical protein II3_05190 [Bacillus cereus MC67]EOP08341.1 hypothetical protein II1_04084 [Bacillus cereus MC118]